VKYVEPNHVYTLSAPEDEPYYSRLWGLNNTGQSGGVPDSATGTPTDIDAPEAWDIFTPAGSVIVAVMDTGVDYNHPDLSSRMWINSGEDIGRDGRVTSKDFNGRDDDGNGLVDDVRGYNFFSRNANPMDPYGHGTHVAGTIAARGNNNFGITGVAGTASVKIMPLRIFGLMNFGGQLAVSTTDAIAIKALTYARKKGAKIANNSWGGPQYGQTLRDAIQVYANSGKLFVAAAGNDAINIDTTPFYPAGFNVDNIISVAAVDSQGHLASFSNYGVSNVDLGAPGVHIFSTHPGGRFEYSDGTSMAAPHVAGVAALIWAENPSFTYTQVKAQILSNVRTTQSLKGVVSTEGMLNAEAALP
jgi:subtilisin family serine protease